MGLKMKLSIILLLAVFSLSPGRANAATVSDISRQLICQCGCNMVLLNCSHAECASREAMTTLIEQKTSQGQTEAQIVQFFVDQYGEQVLAAPPKQGFNLMAWVTPFAVLLLGGGVVYVSLKKWLRRGRQIGVVAEVEESDEYWSQLEKELAEFSDRSFR